MVEIDKYHKEIYRKFIDEYSAKFRKESEIVNKEDVDYYKAVDVNFPMIEVYFKDGHVFTVNRIDKYKIAWEEGNDFYPQQSGYKK